MADGKGHGSTVAKTLGFPQESIVVIDKGYNDCAWYKQLTDKGIFFVTRLKKNAYLRVIERRDVIKNKGVTSDQIIEFTGVLMAKRCPYPLRRIGYRDHATGKHDVF